MPLYHCNRVVLAALLVLGGLSLCGAKAKKEPPAAESFLAGDFFKNGMSLADAETLVADPKVWQVVFRIDTPSTSDLAVVYRRQYFWRVSFYQGNLYALEKRGEVEPEVVEATFKALGEQYGESREATRSEDGGLVYSRWRLENLEISMTASREPDGLYRVTYEEADPRLLSMARRKQEQEMQAAPGDIDPITGKPRPHRHGGAGKAAEPDSEQESQKGKAKQKNKARDRKRDEDQTDGKDKSEEEAGDDKDGNGEDAVGEQPEDPQEEDGETEEKSAAGKKPPVRRDDPGDW